MDMMIVSYRNNFKNKLEKKICHSVDSCRKSGPLS